MDKTDGCTDECKRDESRHRCYEVVKQEIVQEELVETPEVHCFSNCVSLYITHVVYTPQEINVIENNFFIAADQRICHEGKYCYDCTQAKWPGYPLEWLASRSGSDLKYRAHNTRGRVRIIEMDAATYGASIVVNDYSLIVSTLGNTNISHNALGATRQSLGPFYLQSSGANQVDVYAMHAHGGAAAQFEKIYTTQEDIVEQLGSDFYIFWPTENFFLTRQYNGIQWDGFGLNSDSVAVSKDSASFPWVKQFEKYSTGKVKMEGHFPLDPVFSNELLVAVRIVMRSGTETTYVTGYKWKREYFTQVFNHEITTSDTTAPGAPLSIVSYGKEGVVVTFEDNTKTAFLFDTEGPVYDAKT